MTLRTLLSIGALALALTLNGCRSHVVRCDGKLTPINLPAPAKHAKDAPAESAP